MKKTPRTWPAPFVICAGCLACAGCSQEFPAEKFETTRVEGKISVAGKPLTSGFIQFAPVDGTLGHLRSSFILPDGSFVVDGVGVGRNLVGLAGVFGPPIYTKYGTMTFRDFHDYQSPIRKEIPSGKVAHVEIDLLTEATVFQHDRQLPYPPMTPAP